MSYRIYTTDAFVLGSRPAGEASLQFTLFTHELGLVRAHAQGVQLLASKLRAGLQTLTASSVSLVRGREVWRLTSTSAHAHAATKRLCADERVVWARILALVERLVRGEEQDELLYQMLVAIAAFLAREELSSDELLCLELLAKLRILHHLGYVGGTSVSLEPFLHEEVSREVLRKLEGHAGVIAGIIATSLQATQL